MYGWMGLLYTLLYSIQFLFLLLFVENIAPQQFLSPDLLGGNKSLECFNKKYIHQVTDIFF